MDYDEFLKEWRGGTPFITVRTSGSTGKPKEIRLDKDFMRESAHRTIKFFGLTKDSHIHSCISPDYIGGKMMAVRAEMAGCQFSYETPSNRPMTNIPKSKVLDLVAVVPSQVSYILHSEGPEITNLLIGGSAIPDSLREEIADSGISAWESYGMTETSSHIALRKIEKTVIPFRTMVNIKVTKDSRDCLVIKFGDGQEIITNDLAELISEEEFLIKGRIDDVIISGGIKINPYEIEDKLKDAINQPFIVGALPDLKWGEKVVLIIEGEGDEEESSRINSLILSKLKSYERPKNIIRVKELPRTSNGKLKRK